MDIGLFLVISYRGSDDVNLLAYGTKSLLLPKDKMEEEESLEVNPVTFEVSLVLLLEEDE